VKILNFSPEDTKFDAVLAQGVAQLARGHLVAMPTETVYGLAGDATNGVAVARIFEVKRRPQFNPLIAHVGGLEMAKKIGVFDEISLALARKFWPGPLTLVVEKTPSSKVHELVTAGLHTIAIRCPGGSAQKLVEAFGAPLAAPSANRSGRVSATCADHVADAFSREDMLLLDGGNCAVGIESTIVRVEAGRISVLRHGSISALQITLCTGVEVEHAGGNGKIIAPGAMKSHYAPRSGMVLNCTKAQNDTAVLAFGDTNGHLNLSKTGDLREAASNLYRHIRELDELGMENICVAPIPFEGLGIAINDRLARAAAPRIFTKGEE